MERFIYRVAKKCTRSVFPKFHLQKIMNSSPTKESWGSLVTRPSAKDVHKYAKTSDDMFSSCLCCLIETSQCSCVVETSVCPSPGLLLLLQQIFLLHKPHSRGELLHAVFWQKYLFYYCLFQYKKICVYYIHTSKIGKQNNYAQQPVRTQSRRRFNGEQKF